MFLDPATNMSILFNELKVQGFIVTTFMKDWPTAFVELQGYINNVRNYENIISLLINKI